MVAHLPHKRHTAIASAFLLLLLFSTSCCSARAQHIKLARRLRCTSPSPSYCSRVSPHSDGDEANTSTNTNTTASSHLEISTHNQDLQVRPASLIYGIEDLDVEAGVQTQRSEEEEEDDDEEEEEGKVASYSWLRRKSVLEERTLQYNRSSSWGRKQKKKKKKKKRIRWGGFVPLNAVELVDRDRVEEQEEGGSLGLGLGLGLGSGSEETMLLPPPSLVVVEKSGTFDKYWCIARPWASAEVVQAALDWACGHSADCRLIQLAQPCYVPNTLLSHASFAFNSYFQIHGQATGTCDFGGAAMITNIDPSYPGCNYPFRAGQVGAPISHASSIRGGGRSFAVLMTTSFLLPLLILL